MLVELAVRPVQRGPMGSYTEELRLGSGMGLGFGLGCCGGWVVVRGVQMKKHRLKSGHKGHALEPFC